VANYEFTTLEPSLGAYYELIIADIPGLIAGASEGRGLGIKFLQHIERTKTFFHLISAKSADPVNDYKIIRGELEKYNPELLKREEYVFLSQSDLSDENKNLQKIKELKKICKKVEVLSTNEVKTIQKTEKILRKVIKSKKA
jgi:GTP-binding protein